MHTLKMLTFRRFTIIFLLGALLLGCRPEDPAPVVEMPDVQTAPVLVQGTFQREEHATSGEATLYQRPDGRLLVLENFRTDNGPALYVYLSQDRTANSIVDLGVLKSTSGTFSYPVPESVDLAQYPYVLVWCQRFSVLFGSAQLMKP